VEDPGPVVHGLKMRNSPAPGPGSQDGVFSGLDAISDTTASLPFAPPRGALQLVQADHQLPSQARMRLPTLNKQHAWPPKPKRIADAPTSRQ
jgi:hypothetical protein